ncbi:hypothetical protein Scep_027170 [Stephania cephalantha]|uniref:Pentatricopeptide repeat-containing protein n=1 Tax=Stephania cephalantha TaxID=152367 RepID=A0AAP0HT91_9MAGN
MTTTTTTRTRSPHQHEPVSANSANKAAQTSHSAFDSIPRPNTVLWNTIIIGFIFNGFPSDALRFYARMSHSSPPPKSDSYTYSSALKACAHTRHLPLGKSLHCRILRTHSKLSPIVANSLLNMYSSCLSPWFELGGEEMGLKNCEFSRGDSVQKVFDKMGKRNVVSWNTMIAWYVRTGRAVLALKQFKLMMSVGIKPTAVSFVNVFPAVAASGDRKNCNVLYGLLLKFGSEYVNDLFVVSSAISMYSEVSDVESIRLVFSLSIERNTEVWNTMIGGYVQNGCYEEGLDVFLRVLGLDDIVPDNVTFLAALTAISQLQRLEFGRQVHAYVVKNSMASETIILNALIAMYSKCDSIMLAFKVFEKMLDRDSVSWNTMISAFVQNGLDHEGLMLVYEMQKQGFILDSVTMTALLSAASNIGDSDIGKQTHAYLFRHGIRFEGMDSYLIDMYAKSGLIKLHSGCLRILVLKLETK